MAGNSKRVGAVRKRAGGNPPAGSGGRRRQALEGKGPTPKAADRKGHKAFRKSDAPKPRTTRPEGARGRTSSADWVIGRNAVVEALEAGVPVTAMYLAEQMERDERVRTAIRLASERGLSVLEVSRPALDKMTTVSGHQGLALKVPSYEYADPADLLERGMSSERPVLLVGLDGVTDPHNLGAVVRSAAAFGAHGVVVPERRAAGMTASAWKASAGAASRVPVARTTNLTRQIESYKKQGVMVVGLAAEATTPLGELDLADGPLMLLVGSEGAGLSRLVRDACDLLVTIPMAAGNESLNASVAAGVALYEIDRRRRG